ncbi:MAG: MATE family efflux transporter [Clostridiales bacterium]|nr:MATE family efflux transporter [Clostridiales bacterium]
MTSGSILKKICIFAAPCILGRVLQNLNNLVDSVIAGQALDMNALAAVGATGSIIGLFTDTIIGLMSGFSIIAGRRCGSGDHAGLRKVFANSLIISAGAGLFVSLFGALLARGMLSLMKTPADIIDGATVYLTIIFMGMWTTVFYNFLCEMLRAIGNSRTPLIFLIISSAVHFLLLLVLLFVFDLGIVGAALSTIISQAGAALMCALYIKKKVPEFRILPGDMKPDREVLGECLRIGIPMATTNFVVMFGVIILGFVTNRIGTDYVAAYSTASKTGYIITTPIFGFATAASVFVSQNLGAGRLDRIKEGVRKVLLLITAINAVLFTVMLFAARPLMSLMIDGGSVAVDAGVLYLRVRCTAMFILTLAAVFKPVLAALGRPLFPTISGFIEVAVRYIVPLTLTPLLGFAAVPLTDAIIWLILAVFLTGAYIFEFNRLTRSHAASNA